jgi:hypothetical protein
MSDNPNFLRPPPPPRVSQHDLSQPITQRELVELWSKVGVIQRANLRHRISRTDFLGVLSLVAALAFCLGYYLAS